MVVSKSNHWPIWLKLALIALIWRLSLLTLAMVAPAFLAFQPSYPYAVSLLAQPLPTWISTWAGFDGVHYLTIIEKGYVGTGLIQAFFPVFPFLIKILSLITQQPILTGLIFNLCSTWLALWLAWRLLRLDFSAQSSWFGIFALILFPTSFFLGAFYSEALFLVLSLGALLAIRLQKWWLASILIAIASATRITGIFLLLVMMWEWGTAKRWRYEDLKNSFSSQIWYWLVGSLGLVSYMGYLWQTFGDPLFFLHVQQEFGAGRSESIVLYPQVVWRYLKMLLTVRPIDWKYFSIISEFAAGILPILALIKVWRLIRPSYVVYGLASFLLPTLTGTFSSMPRYILVIWPIFCGLAILYSKKPKLAILYLIFSSLLLIINTILFIQGYWVA